MAITTLKRRPEFLRVRGGGRASLNAFVIEGKARVAAAQPATSVIVGAPADPTARDPRGAEHGEAARPVAIGRRPVAEVSGPRFGFTVTKKIGNAVVRNRIRRRLKAIVAGLPPGRARADFDYVVIAREAAIERPFAALAADFAAALGRVHSDRAPGVSRGKGQPRKEQPGQAQPGKTIDGGKRPARP